jgi:hypothetical protein
LLAATVESNEGQSKLLKQVSRSAIPRKVEAKEERGEVARWQEA